MLGTDNSEGDDRLDLSVHSSLLRVVLLVLVRVHPDVVESELLLDAVLELLTLLKSERVGLGDDGDNVDGLAQLLENDDIDRLQAVARRRDEVKAAVDTGILDVAEWRSVKLRGICRQTGKSLPLTLSSQFLPEVGRVLVLDVLDNGVPAAVVVDKVAIAGSVNNVQAQSDAVLLNNVGDGLDLGGLSGRLGRREAALGLDEVRGEDGVDQSRLAETGLACMRVWLA